VLSEAKVRALSAAFFGLVVDDGGVGVPAGSIFLKFGAWCVCYFAQRLFQ
jgi:hypothetical protein